VGTTAPGQPFAGNIIPTSALDPASLDIAQNYLPHVGGDGGIFYTRPTVQNITQVILRVDHRLSDKDTLTGRWYKDHISYAPQNPAGNLLGYQSGYNQPLNNVMIQETHTFKSNLLNLHQRLAQRGNVWSNGPVAAVHEMAPEHQRQRSFRHQRRCQRPVQQQGLRVPGQSKLGERAAQH
jgi:hypothetical protein